MRLVDWGFQIHYERMELGGRKLVRWIAEDETSPMTELVMSDAPGTSADRGEKSSESFLSEEREERILPFLM